MATMLSITRKYIMKVQDIETIGFNGGYPPWEWEKYKYTLILSKEDS